MFIMVKIPCPTQLDCLGAWRTIKSPAVADAGSRWVIYNSFHFAVILSRNYQPLALLRWHNNKTGFAGSDNFDFRTCRGNNIQRLSSANILARCAAKWA